MSDATIWWLLAGAVVALELLSGTFYLLMLALGLAAGAIAAHSGAGLTVQLWSAALLGGGAVLSWSRLARRRDLGTDSSTNPDLNLDIGRFVQVTSWNADGTTNVWHRGARWEAELEQPAAPAGSGRFRIIAVRGSRLVLAASPQPEN